MSPTYPSPPRPPRGHAREITRFGVGALLLAAAGLPPTAGAQAPPERSYELTYTERVEHATLLDAATAASLPDHELIALQRPPVDTTTVTDGFSLARGLYLERVLENPLAGREAWRQSPPARTVINNRGTVVTAADGEVLAAGDYRTPAELAEVDAMEAAAARGEFRPYLPALLPTPDELAAYRAAGYRVSDGAPATVARATATPPQSPASPPPGAVPAAPLTHQLSVLAAGADPEVARRAPLVIANDRERITYADGGRTQTTTAYAVDGAGARVAVAHEIAVYDTAAGIGAPGYLPVARLTARRDTLGSGAVVTRVRLESRSGHGYVEDGRPLVTAAGASASAVEVFPNPLSGNALTVLAADPRGRGFTVRLVDPLGREILSEAIPSGPSALLTVPPAAPGLYTLTVTDADGAETVRRIVIR